MVNKVALITGAAARLGAETSRHLHNAGYDIIIHYRRSAKPAKKLADQLNQLRKDSATTLQADLLEINTFPALLSNILTFKNRLDLLVNNASTFYPTEIGATTEEQWDDLIGSNMKAPYFLSQAVADALKKTSGCIINMVDIHAQRPLKSHTVYSMAKAANAMMVQSLARELGPEVRVNGVAPGAILWPSDGMSDNQKEEILQRTTLKRPGTPVDIAKTILFLASQADYISGQIIAVDGGRTTQQ